MPEHTEPAFVLVHGTNHGGWCWQRVAKRLRDAGHLVYALEVQFDDNGPRND